MTIKHEILEELQIIQQFIHLKNGKPTLTTWFRIEGVKQKAEKEVFVTYQEEQKLQHGGYIDPEYSIPNFR